MNQTLVANIEVTRACNLHCFYCNVVRSEPVEELSSDGLTSLLSVFTSMPRPVHIFLTGGEPLLHLSLGRWLDATLDAAELMVSVSTNGTLVTRSVVKMLSRARLGSVLVSVDGWDQASHDFHSGVPGSFTALMSGLRLLLDSPIHDSVITNTVLTHANAGSWQRIVEMLQSLGVQRMKFSPVLLPGNGADNPSLRLTRDDLASYSAIRRQQAGWQNESFPGFEARMLDVISNRTTSAPGCYAGSRFIFVRSDGFIFPCWQTSGPSFTIRYPLNHYCQRRAVDVLPYREDLIRTMGAAALRNREGVCRDCCDACNLRLNELYLSGGITDAPASMQQ